MHVRRLVLWNEYAKNMNGYPLFFQDNQISISEEARNIINRIVNFSRNPTDCNQIPCLLIDWRITNPKGCIPLSIDVGSNFGYGTFLYPMAEIQCRSDNYNFTNNIYYPSVSFPSVCGPFLLNPYHDFFTLGSLSLWNTSSSVPGTGLTDGNGGGWGANGIFYDKIFSGYLGAVCNCMFLGNSNVNMTSTFLNNISMLRNIQNNQSYYYYYNIPYSHAILFNKNVNDNSAITPFIDVINYMNPCVHFDFGNGNYGNPAWATDTRIEHLERLDIDEYLGEYPGFDYLLYHNLWYLYHKIKGTNGINTTMYDFSNIY